jgi:nicotinate dehydrogenase subunit B
MIPTMSDILRRELSRRGILQGAGVLIVSFAAPASISFAATASTKPPLTPDQLDSFIAVHPDGSATAFFGKIDGGQGTDLGIAQIVAEELDLELDRVSVVMGDTARTVDQGGASGSTGIWRGGAALRAAAAEARRILLDMAAQTLGAPASNLVVADGVVTVEGNAAKHVTYGQLVGGHYFNAKLDWNKQFGNALEIKPSSPLKSPHQYKIVGKGFPRRDVAPKVFARFDYVTDMKVPGMAHGRMIRPPVAGATPVAIDEASIGDIPGVRVVHKDGFLGVVADKEWNAIRAAQRLQVTWSQAAPAFVDADAIYDHIRKAPVRHRQVEAEKGSVDQALAGAAKVLTSEYEWPFQSHASMGPACALVAIKDGKVTIWTGSQKPHYSQEGVSKMLNVPMENVHAIWKQ